MSKETVDMDFKEMLTGLFNTDFLKEEELDTICKAAEIYATAKVKNLRQQSGKETDIEKVSLEEYQTLYKNYYDIGLKYEELLKQQSIPDEFEKFAQQAEIDNAKFHSAFSKVDVEDKLQKAIDFEALALDIRKRVMNYNDDVLAFKDWFTQYLQQLNNQ